jgi:two-component system, OmpR family, KDP operon response regulator KdpE
MTAPSILVVDDEPAIRRTLRVNLTASGYAVTAVETGEAALDQVAEQWPNLIILDLMLPGLSGLDTCRALRSETAVPILVLSARGEEEIKVHALDLGADDYLTKPFGMEELLARVRALLRRPPTTAPSDGGMLRVGNLALDLDRREVQRGTTRLDLTAREFDVLAYLMRHTGKVVTHRLLLTEVWGPEYRDDTHYLHVFINRLRNKIEDDTGHPRYIVTDPGVGYRLLPAFGDEAVPVDPAD